jgi:hypothetical protein
MKMKQSIEIQESVKEIKFLLKVVSIKPNRKKMENEKEQIQEAIKEIRFLVQVIQDLPVKSSISKDIKKRFVQNLQKEEQDYTEYFESTWNPEELQKKIDDMIDCQIEDLKIQRDENSERSEK